MNKEEQDTIHLDLGILWSFKVQRIFQSLLWVFCAMILFYIRMAIR